MSISTRGSAAVILKIIGSQPVVDRAENFFRVMTKRQQADCIIGITGVDTLSIAGHIHSLCSIWQNVAAPYTCIELGIGTEARKPVEWIFLCSSGYSWE